VIHFDSHLDTWKPSVFGGAPSLQAAINHGTYFYWASQEGLIKNGSSIASIRILFLTLFLFLRSDRFDPSLAFDSTVPLGQHCLAHLTIRMTMPPDFRELKPVKSTQLVIFITRLFVEVCRRLVGTDGIVKKIRDTVGDLPVYLSIDVRQRCDPRRYALTQRCKQIDSIDPAFAPATGTPETGGWSTRELRTILRGLDGLHIVSADIVEVAPAYDTNAELTTMAAADVSLILIVGFLMTESSRNGERCCLRSLASWLRHHLESKFRCEGQNNAVSFLLSLPACTVLICFVIQVPYVDIRSCQVNRCLRPDRPGKASRHIDIERHTLRGFNSKRELIHQRITHSRKLFAIKSRSPSDILR
jgi:arginase family enzyme